MNKEQQLENFSWDAKIGAEDVDFFGTTPEKPADPKEVKKKEEKKDVKKETETKETETKKVEAEETKFFEIDEKNKEEEKEDKSKLPVKKTEKKDKSETELENSDNQFFNVLANEMKDSGIFSSVDVPEEDLEEKEFAKLLETEVDNRVQETFEGFFEELDDDAKSFLKHKRDGGNTRQFFVNLNSTSNIPEGELGDDRHDKAIARYYFKNIEHMDDEEVADRIQWLEDTGKTSKNAERYDKKIKAHTLRQTQMLEKGRKDAIKDAENNAKNFSKTIKTVLKESEDVKGFTITKSDKKELLPYITESEVKIGKNKFITGLQSDLRKIMGSPDKLILLAKLLKSDFDTSSITTKEKTKTTRTIKENLSRAKKNTKTTSSEGSKSKSLSDFF